MPGHAQPAGGVAPRARSALGAVVDLADDLLEQILERDDARRAAVLVDHDRELRALAPHGRQHRVEQRRLRARPARAARRPRSPAGR